MSEIIVGGGYTCEFCERRIDGSDIHICPMQPTTPLADVEGSHELLPPASVQVTFCGKCGQTGLHNTRCGRCGNRLEFNDELTYTRSLDASGYVKGLREAWDTAIDIVNQSLNADDAVAKLEEQRDALISQHQEGTR